MHYFLAIGVRGRVLSLWKYFQENWLFPKMCHVTFKTTSLPVYRLPGLWAPLWPSHIIKTQNLFLFWVILKIVLNIQIQILVVLCLEMPVLLCYFSMFPSGSIDRSEVQMKIISNLSSQFFLPFDGKN